MKKMMLLSTATSSILLLLLSATVLISGLQEQSATVVGGVFCVVSPTYREAADEPLNDNDTVISAIKSPGQLLPMDAVTVTLLEEELRKSYTTSRLRIAFLIITDE
jgi:hypothetical protein